jgi:hypothetical protein
MKDWRHHECETKAISARGADGRWLPGANGGGHRQAGTRNKYSAAFLADALASWEKH